MCLVSMEAEKGIGPPGTGVTLVVSCRAGAGWEWSPGYVQGQPVLLLATEPSLQPQSVPNI